MRMIGASACSWQSESNQPVDKPNKTNHQSITLEDQLETDLTLAAFMISGDISNKNPPLSAWHARKNQGRSWIWGIGYHQHCNMYPQIKTAPLGINMKRPNTEKLQNAETYIISTISEIWKGACMLVGLLQGALNQETAGECHRCHNTPDALHRPWPSGQRWCGEAPPNWVLTKTRVLFMNQRVESPTNSYVFATNISKIFQNQWFLGHVFWLTHPEHGQSGLSNSSLHPSSARTPIHHGIFHQLEEISAVQDISIPPFFLWTSPAEFIVS